jgi:hypothetical protein
MALNVPVKYSFRHSAQKVEYNLSKQRQAESI